jgi:hypothetical protein
MTETNEMSKLRWKKMPQYYAGARPGLMAQVVSRNGGFGCAFITQRHDGQGFDLTAASETTGRDWKSPAEPFRTVAEAKAAAEELWRPA